MSDLNALVSENIGAISTVLVLLVLVLLVGLVLALRRLSELEARLSLVTRGADGEDLAGVLEAHLDKVYAVAHRQDQLDERAAGLEQQARRTVQGVGLVRFNNFDDTGGNQSFAMALTDTDGNGIVLSSLHARNQTRLYAKGVAAGTPEGALSAQESEALRLALARAQGR